MADGLAFLSPQRIGAAAVYRGSLFEFRVRLCTSVFVLTIQYSISSHAVIVSYIPYNMYVILLWRTASRLLSWNMGFGRVADEFRELGVRQG